jgi:hypothetical protein
MLAAGLVAELAALRDALSLYARHAVDALRRLSPGVAFLDGASMRGLRATGSRRRASSRSGSSRGCARLPATRSSRRRRTRRRVASLATGFLVPPRRWRHRRPLTAIAAVQ